MEKKRIFKKNLNFPYFLKFQKGFSLTELMVVTAVVISLTFLVMVNQRFSQKKFALQRSAHQLAQDIRRAQEMAMSGRECPECEGQLPTGYGIQLRTSQGSNMFYKLYADTGEPYEFYSEEDDITIEVIQLEGGDTTGENYAVVIDVGTSTVVAHLIDLNTGETIDAEATYNSQKVYGEEVTRRIIYAEQNRLDKLREVVVGDINNLITALVTRSKVKLNDIMAILCAGNTAMVHFLLGFNPSRIRKEPYIPVCISPPPIRAVEIGVKVNPRGLLYCLPSIASWVGADITAGILATGLYRAKDLTMLIDIGTNGEIVIGNREWMVCCSASAGPAFEGSGVKCGMRASEGAIEKVSIRSGKDIKYTTIGDSRPMGICGSGLIDLIAELFTAGFIDRSGGLDLSRDKRIRKRDGEAEFVLVPAQHSATGEDIVLTQPDIDSLIRAKAAVFAAINILIGSLNLEFEDIRRIYLAGGFGNYLDRKKALTIGLIPDLPLERIQFVGNTSIMGAKIAMLSQEALETCYEISRKITYYDLITHSNYMDEFMSAKFLPHTDLDKFPDVSVSKV